MNSDQRLSRTFLLDAFRRAIEETQGSVVAGTVEAVTLEKMRTLAADMQADAEAQELTDRLIDSTLRRIVDHG